MASEANDPVPELCKIIESMSREIACLRSEAAAARGLEALSVSVFSPERASTSTSLASQSDTASDDKNALSDESRVITEIFTEKEPNFVHAHPNTAMLQQQASSQGHDGSVPEAYSSQVNMHPQKNSDEENHVREDVLMKGSPTLSHSSSSCASHKLDHKDTSARRSNGKAVQEVKRQHQEVKRQCEQCGTTETPKWRSGTTLCNACGLRKAKRARTENSLLPCAPSLSQDSAKIDFVNAWANAALCSRNDVNTVQFSNPWDPGLRAAPMGAAVSHQNHGFGWAPPMVAGMGMVNPYMTAVPYMESQWPLQSMPNELGQGEQLPQPLSTSMSSIHGHRANCMLNPISSQIPCTYIRMDAVPLGSAVLPCP